MKFDKYCELMLDHPNGISEVHVRINENGIRINKYGYNVDDSTVLRFIGSYPEVKEFMDTHELEVTSKHSDYMIPEEMFKE